jgi:methylenetetrahydrofolate reductase (NADPH)
MKISEIFQKQVKTFSFEFFPPKDEISAVEFGINIGQLMKLKPSFVSVTYGAGGSNQSKTFALVDLIQNKLGITCMAHYTCINASKKKVKSDIEFLKSIGIENLMLLRGDLPEGNNEYTNNDFKYASDLISFVRQHGDFCIGAAAYPEKHPQSADEEIDLINLKKKVDAGADFLITQLFFNNDNYFRFIEKARKKGIMVKIIPGLIPITNFHQIKRFAKITGAIIPETLYKNIEKYSDDSHKIYKIGVEYAIEQAQELLEAGAPGIHFYTLNKSRATIEIFEELSRRGM